MKKNSRLKTLVVLGGLGTCLVYIYISQMYENVVVRHMANAIAMVSPNPTAFVTSQRDVSKLIHKFHNLDLFETTVIDRFARFISFNVSDDGKQCIGRRFLIYVCKSGCGGWGDRLKGITTLFLVAQFTNRTFLIDMPKPCNIQTLVTPNLYDWKQCLTYAKQIKEPNATIHFSEINPKIITNMTFGGNSKKKVISLSTNRMAFQMIKDVNISREAIPWIHKLSEAEVLGSVIGILFRSSRSIADDLIKFKLEKIRGRRLVCTHIRYGKNPTIPNEDRLTQGTPNVTKVLGFLKNYDKTNDSAIFVATDSEEVRNRSRKLFSNFVSTEKKIVHVDKYRGKANEACDGFSAALLDQLILSKCDVLVLTRSNFGAMASYMRGTSRDLFLNIKNETRIASVNVSDIQRIYEFV